MGLLFTRRGMGVYVSKDALKICRGRCYATIMSRLHEVTQEAKAAGFSKSQISEIVTKRISVGGSPYAATPAAVTALARKLR